MRRSDGFALLLLLAIGYVVERHARLWHPLTWVGDLGNLPYQCLRMSWGEVIYRDFAAKNPIGVFVVPFLAFRALGPSINALAWLTALQFISLLGATYLVARRSAPRCAWVVLPLSLFYCMGSCGLVHHPWAGAVGLLSVPVLYNCLFEPERPRWALAGAWLGLVGLFHQLLFVMVGLAALLYSLATAEDRRAALATLARAALVAAATVMSAYTLLALTAGPDMSLPGRALESNLRFMLFHQGMAANNPLLVSDLWLFPPLEPGPVGLAQRILEILNKGLTYFGFPALALLTLKERRAEGERGGWLSWLLLSGGLIALSAYPQFLFAHIRAFLAPFSFILIARRLEERRGWLLGLAVALVSLLGLEEAVVSLAGARYPVRFPAGVVEFASWSEARGFQTVCDEMSGQEPRQPLLVYPYFPMAYFLFERVNPFRIHEIYPSKLMAATGVVVEDPAYQEGMQALSQHPPLYALNDIGPQTMFAALEQMETRRDPGNPLLDFMRQHYQPVAQVQLDDGTPWIVLLKLSLPPEPIPHP